MADRDPLHDDRLDEALADAAEHRADEGRHSDDDSVLSTLTAALEAADRSASPERLATGPHGPPPPVPVTHPPRSALCAWPDKGAAWGHARRGHGVGTKVVEKPGSDSDAPLAAGWTGVSDGTTEVHMWRSVRLVLAEADDDAEGERIIDFQDVENALFDQSTHEAPLRTTASTGNTTEAEHGENLESEEYEHDSLFTRPDSDEGPFGSGRARNPAAADRDPPSSRGRHGRA